MTGTSRHPPGRATAALPTSPRPPTSGRAAADAPAEAGQQFAVEQTGRAGKCFGRARRTGPRIVLRKRYVSMFSLGWFKTHHFSDQFIDYWCDI